MRRRRNTQEDDKADRWVVSYADFVTLLFAFFTTMYAISHVDLGKLEKFAGSMKSAFNAGATTGDAGAIIEGIKPVNYSDVKLEQEIRARFQKFDIIEGIVVSRDDRGISVSFEDSVLFDTGEAWIKKEALPLLDAAASLIRGTRNPIVIEGHTDNVPIRSARYPSNWELSTARATSVLVHLVRQHGLGPERFSASGYGEYRPIATNATPAGRAKNRRVDIRFVSDENRPYGTLH